MTEERDYEIRHLAAEVGGGWLLRLLLNGEEVSADVFAEHDDALAAASVWLSVDDEDTACAGSMLSASAIPSLQ
jgi:uncharacterized protein (DUF39 family)